MIELSERQEQEIVIEFIDKQYPWLRNHTIYIMNEKKCSIYVGKKLNSQGRLSGASDLFLAYPTKQYCGLFIEMKSLKGKPSKKQIEFINRMVSVGYYACICYGADEAIPIINRYVKEKL